METRKVGDTVIKFLDEQPKYSQLENERKWLVKNSVKALVQNTWHYLIIDRYIIGTRIRIRMTTDSNSGESIYKLTKKYGLGNNFSEPISSFYISKEEYELFKILPCREITKKRYLHTESNTSFSIDIFENDHDGLLLAEVEANNVEELMKIKSPSFAIREVTEEKEFTGGFLAFGTG